MSSMRIPVSLKFDTDSDMFNDFIVELRDSRELSSFIVELLTLYYEDDEVRSLINYKRERNNPFSPLYQKLQEINLQHTKTIVATNMLVNQTQGIVSNLEKEGLLEKDNPFKREVDESTFTMNITDATPQKPTEVAPTALPQPSDITVLFERMEKLEKLLPNIMDTLNQLLQNNQGQSQAPSRVEGTPQVQATVQPVIQSDPVIQPEIQPKSEVQPVTPTEPEINLEMTEQGISTNSSTSAEPALVILDEPTVVVPNEVNPQIGVSEEKPTKPASFGKALGSLKKKR